MDNLVEIDRSKITKQSESTLYLRIPLSLRKRFPVKTKVIFLRAYDSDDIVLRKAEEGK